MKVLLRRNIPKLGTIGDVVEVKAGYARNCLIPQRLALAPSEGNLRAIEAEKQAYLQQLALERKEMETQAQLIQGKEVTIASRANEEGHLYGSVGPAQVAAALAAEGVFIEAEQIVLDTPIRQLDKYDLVVRFGHDVNATIHVWIVPRHGDDDEAEGDEAAQAEQADAPPQADAAEDVPADQSA